MDEQYLGYVTTSGMRLPGQRLTSRQEIISFLQKNLYEDEVIITDLGDGMLFQAIDGVDLYSDLVSLGIDLQSIYQEIRNSWQIDEPSTEREPWEDQYDSIGLSPGEVRMRQRVKQACKSARSVADVARLLKGTYFNARFYSEDRSRVWGYFDLDEYSVIVLNESDVGVPGEEQEKTAFLNPQARVRHISSGEDIHTFVLLDPPEDDPQ